MKESDFFKKLPDLQLKDVENMYNEGIFISSDFNKYGLDLKKDSDENLISARKIISLYDQGVIIPYLRNRGMGTISKPHIDEIFNSFDPNFLGVMYVSEFPFNKLILCDFHHRIYVIKRYFENPKAIDFNIRVKFVSIHDALETYKSLNTHKAHTTKNKLTNKDYALGYMILPILERYKLSMNYSTHMANLCLCYGAFQEKITYPQVYAQRNLTLQNSNKLGSQKEFFEITNLTPKQFNDITKAIALYVEFIRCLEQKFNSKKDFTLEFKSIKKSIAFFSYFTTDCLKQESIFNSQSNSIKKVANKLFPILSTINDFLDRIIGKGDEIVKINTYRLDDRIIEELTSPGSKK